VGEGVVGVLGVVGVPPKKPPPALPPPQADRTQARTNAGASRARRR